MRRCLPPIILKRGCRNTLSLLAFLCCYSIADGETLPEVSDDLLSGFDDVEIELSPTVPEPPSLLDHISGYAKLFSAVNTTHSPPGPDYGDWYGLSALRLETVLEVTYQFSDWKIFCGVRGFYDFAYSINGRQTFTSEVLNNYETELELQEAFLQGALSDHVDLKIGRQIVVWGRSDNFRVTDVLNPLDNRDIGITDIENIRLPLGMIKLDLFLGDWNIDIISILEHRYDENPVYGHYLYPVNAPPSSEIIPSNTLDNSEIGVEISKTFSGWDFSLYGGHFYNDQATYLSTTPLIMKHEKISMLGTSLGLARGNVLYIVELAHFNDIRFMNSEQGYARTDLLVGFEYSGWTETTIAMDYVRRHLHQFNTVLEHSPEKPKETEHGVALRISSDFLHDTLQLTGLIMVYGEHNQYEAMERVTLRYNIVDDWSVTTGLVLYQARDNRSLEYDDTVRAFLELRYDF